MDNMARPDDNYDLRYYGNPMKWESTKGDLISREALKKSIKSYADDQYAENEYLGEYAIMDIIDNAPTVEPEKVLIANITFDEDKLKEIFHTEVIDKIKSGELVLEDERPQSELVIKCQDCKHQKKYWHEDKRMKEKGYWIYGCDLRDDPFVGTPVWGADNQFCSSAEARK